jgi:divalent metal cation (Fe/Co/Zn/Cd) transporter
MEWVEPDRGDPFARSVGAALVGEAFVLVASRIFTLIYSVAREVDVPDKHRTPATTFLLFTLISIVLVTILSWAGGQMRRTPSGAWRAASLPGRVDLAVASLLNVALVSLAVAKLTSSESLGGEALIAWLLTAAMALAVVVGIVRDAAGRARPTVER